MTNIRPIFPGSIKNVGIDIENADGTTIQDFITAGVDGSRVNNVSVISTDTAAVDLLIYFNDGTDDFQLGRVTIPIGAGTNGTDPPVSLFNNADFPFLNADDLSYYLEGTKKLRVAAQAAVTSALKVSLVATYGDY